MDNPSGEILFRHCFWKYLKKVSNFGQSQGCIPIGICRSEYVEEIKTAGRNRIALISLRMRPPHCSRVYLTLDHIFESAAKSLWYCETNTHVGVLLDKLA